MPQTTESQDTNDILRTCLNLLPQQATERLPSCQPPGDRYGWLSNNRK